MEQSAKIVMVFIDTTDTKNCKKSLDDLNSQLEIGFELRGDPIALPPDRVLYTLLLPKIEHHIDNPSAYPTSKQAGYIRWAFDMQEDDVSELKINKKEASQLIECHKDQYEGRQRSKRHCVRKLDELRGTVAVVKSTVHDQEDKVIASDMYEDDIPF